MKWNFPLKLIIYSAPGIGKTHLFGTSLDVPDLCPIFLIDFEGNTDCIISKCAYVDTKDWATPIEGKITCVRVTNWEEFYTLLESIIKYADKNPDNFPYKLIGLDSLSVTDYNCLVRIMQTQSFKRIATGIPSEADYKVNYWTMMPMIYKLKELPCNVIVTCHEYYPTAEESDTYIRPLLSGKMRTGVPGVFKQTGAYRNVNGVRTIFFIEKGIYFAKQCGEGALLGEKIENPTMTEIWKKQNGN